MYVYVLSAGLCKLVPFQFLVFILSFLPPSPSLSLSVWFYSSAFIMDYTLWLRGQMLPISWVNTEKLLFEVAGLQNSTNIFQYLFLTDM